MLAGAPKSDIRMHGLQSLSSCYVEMLNLQLVREAQTGGNACAFLVLLGTFRPTRKVVLLLHREPVNLDAHGFEFHLRDLLVQSFGH